MNPMTNVKNVKKLSEQELKRSFGSSWHDQYRDSAWIFIGGLPYDLTEGDVLCVFSQYGEIVQINLVRDKVSGKQKGFCFLCYEDQRSTVLAVDNLNGIKLLNRTIRVDHVTDYKPPKENKNVTVETAMLQKHGCAPKVMEELSRKRKGEDEEDDKKDLDVVLIKDPEIPTVKKSKKSKHKKHSKKKKLKTKKSKDKDKVKKKKKRHSSSSSDSSSTDSSDSSSDSD